jgi:hypothetical protein
VAEAQAEKKRTTERHAHAERVMGRTQKCFVTFATGTPCFLTPGANSQEVVVALKSLHCKVVPLTEAEVVLALDPADPGRKAKYAAVLKGAYVASLDALFNGGVGAVIKYKPAIHKGRKLWFTDAYRTKHEALLQVIREVAFGAAGSRWEELESKEDFCKEHERHKKQKRLPVVGMLKLDTEVVEAGPSVSLHVLPCKPRRVARRVPQVIGCVSRTELVFWKI